MEDLSFRGSERGLEFALENGGETYTVSIPATPEEGHLFGDMAAAKVNPANSAPLSSFVDSVLGYTDREVGAELVDIGEELGNGNGDRRIVMTLDGEREVFANPATAIYFDSMAGEDFNYGILTGLGDPQVSPRDHSDWIDMNLEEPREADIPSETTRLSYEAYGVNLEPGYQPLPFLELSGDEADIRFPLQHMMADITPSLMQQQFLRERRKTLGEGETGPGFYPDRALVAASRR
ncbi:MAG: hypothetical protein SVS85_00195, partial [Candidatus Nanohaloarchaea archaeon]|nr:hypothetical protein [Candidatus Nanohaloarchaea archaeon]